MKPAAADATADAPRASGGLRRERERPAPQRDIRIGTLAGKGARTAEYIRAIRGHGFESFQINLWRTLGDVDLARLDDEVNTALAGSDAVISSLAIFGNPLESDPLDQETLRGWEQCIEHAHRFGTDLVCGFTGRLRGRPVPETLPRFREVFGELATRAADCGVRIAFENCWMGGTWQSGDYNIAINPAAWEMIFDALPGDYIGLEWEPAHARRAMIDPMAQLRTWVPRIFHVHGKDASLYPDVIATHGLYGGVPSGHDRFPGFGDSNWADIISELRRHGYRGSIDIEGWHDPVYRDELEMTGQVHALHYLRRCRGGEFVANPEGCV